MATAWRNFTPKASGPNLGPASNPTPSIALIPSTRKNNLPDKDLSHTEIDGILPANQTEGLSQRQRSTSRSGGNIRCIYRFGAGNAARRSRFRRKQRANGESVPNAGP